jgi:hypothetical protein
MFDHLALKLKAHRRLQEQCGGKLTAWFYKHVRESDDIRFEVKIVACSADLAEFRQLVVEWRKANPQEERPLQIDWIPPLSEGLVNMIMQADEHAAQIKAALAEVQEKYVGQHIACHLEWRDGALRVDVFAHSPEFSVYVTQYAAWQERHPHVSSDDIEAMEVRAPIPL